MSRDSSASYEGLAVEGTQFEFNAITYEALFLKGKVMRSDEAEHLDGRGAADEQWITQSRVLIAEILFGE